jgi:hypothetical protein
MSTSKFIKKTAVKIIIFALLVFIVTAVANSIDPIVSNQIAIGQMEHDDFAYILMETYNRFKPIGGAFVFVVTLLFTGRIASDAYKFYKNKKEKKENEEV